MGSILKIDRTESSDPKKHEASEVPTIPENTNGVVSKGIGVWAEARIAYAKHAVPSRTPVTPSSAAWTTTVPFAKILSASRG